MCWKLVLFVVLLAFFVQQQVEAEFYYNSIPPTTDQLDELGLICVPGRTVMKIEHPKEVAPDDSGSGESDDEIAGDMRRSHMNAQTNDEYCKICVCSSEGKDEYCSRRPARNVNECIRMTTLMDEFNKNIPFDHQRTLAYRIRRDYLWHKDEIPYDPKARCRRGFSYYSNDISANDTDLDVPSDIDSLLDYPNKTICYYCVCAVDGKGAGCITRDPWFCDYFRFLRTDGASREMYKNLFKQDRPLYFRELSYRIRRTMDDGLFNFVENVGTGLPPSSKCIPYVSEYTDCTELTKCSGCSKCTCGHDGNWECKRVADCPQAEAYGVSDEALDNAMNFIEMEMERKNRELAKTQLVPRPLEPEDEPVYEYKEGEYERKIQMALMSRKKRAVNYKQNEKEGHNGSIKFHHTLDDINEDTLRHSNSSGTIEAKKIDAKPFALTSRRTGVLDEHNKSTVNSLHIEYKHPKIYNHHITDNKIDTTHEDKIYIDHEKIANVIGNHTQLDKNKELSKLIVNELKNGKEIIGDKKAPIMSNITFTPENDTLTAMAFIAGNLLNKLWNMEKDSGDESIETEIMKHEKIADLIELFKEPLTLRQETFIKNALTQISDAVNKNKDVGNVSLCETIEKAKQDLKDTSKDSIRTDCDKNKEKDKVKSTTEAIDKINNVLHLIKKFENVQKHLRDLKSTSHSNSDENTKSHESHKDITTDQPLTRDENKSISLFGNLLEKITKLLMPNKTSKKVLNKVRKHKLFGNTESAIEELKQQYNIDIDPSSLTVKDRLLLHYLSRIEHNPSCLLDSQSSNKQSVSRIEGDVLLNLSEFFKIKSFVDLLKLVEPGKPSIRNSQVKITTTTETVTTTTVKQMTDKTKVGDSKLEKTKAKLKAHLKTIIEDLLEIQRESGVSGKRGDIKIAEALPCIYRILNNDKDLEAKDLNKDSFSSQENIVDIFKKLKEELKSTPYTRRSNVIVENKAKSAVVWNRVIKNLDSKLNLNTRRHLNSNIPKSFDEIIKNIEKVELSGSHNYPSLKDILPADRLVLLKTLQLDIKRNSDILKDIKLSYEKVKSLPLEQREEIADFINNAAINIELDEKVLSNRDAASKSYVSNENNHPIQRQKVAKRKRPSQIRASENNQRVHSSIKLTRDEILNQLIKNRVQLYLRIKEAQVFDLKDDLNYNIARNILQLLEAGNNKLAKEMYKIFMTNKQENSGNIEKEIVPASTITKPGIVYKEPLIQFEEPKTNSQLQWTNQDHLLKQLLNIKNMKI